MKCALCNEDIESVGHLFFRCRIAYRIWMEIYKWLIIVSVANGDEFKHNIWGWLTERTKLRYEKHAGLGSYGRYG